jgi:regulatory protein
MPKNQIESISPLKRRKGWFEIIFSGQTLFWIDEETIYRYSLKEGQEVSETDLKKIKESADLAYLKDIGMKIISRRMISERDLRRKLAAERRPPDIRDKAVESLLKYGFIDDAKYAAAYIRSQIARGPKSKLYLKKKLYQKGISSEISDKAIAEELEGYDFKESVRELAKKKYKTLKNLPPQKAKMRLMNFLKSRGFGWEVIKYAITDLMVDEMMNDPGELD